MKKIAGLAMALCLISVIFISGCTAPATPTEGAPTTGATVCGNGIIEAGEECDGVGCTSPEVCENCRCVFPQPPALPE